MTRISRLLSIGAITLFVLSSACTMPVQVPATPSATLPTVQQLTIGPSLTADDTSSVTPAPAIPITGMDVVSLQCQFCVNNDAHAVLIMSNQAFFNVADPESGVTCLSAKEMDGRRILLCRGAQNASFVLNICVDNANCLEFPITLQPCPLVPVTGPGTPSAVPTVGALTPVILTPRNTLVPPTNRPGTNPTLTSAPSTPVPTNTNVVAPPATSTTEPLPEPSSTPEPPTVEPPQPTAQPPEPTAQPPEPTAVSGGGGGGGGGGEEDTFVICHVAQGNSNSRTTMTVSRNAWENVHSQHGDSRGAC